MIGNQPAYIFMVAVAAILFASGCTTSPADLKQSSKTDCMVLLEDSSWSESRGMIGLIFEEGLRKGVYRASFEDEAGVYYEGDKASVWQFSYPGDKPKDLTAFNSRAFSDGGVWLPVDLNKPPRIYSYVGASRQGVETTNTSQHSVTNVPIYTPANISPVESGAASGIAAGIVASITNAQKGRILFYKDVGHDQFSKKLRVTSPCPNPKH